MCPGRGVFIVPVAVHAAALGETTATLGLADGLADVLGLNVALGELGPPTAGLSGLVTNKAAPTAITPMTVATAMPLEQRRAEDRGRHGAPRLRSHGERWLDTAL